MVTEATLDLVIHAPARLRIMAALVACPKDAAVAFKRLRGLLALTDGNLGSHLATLAGAGLVEILKDFDGKRPRTRVLATSAGRVTFASHVEALRKILDAAESAAEPSLGTSTTPVEVQ